MEFSFLFLQLVSFSLISDAFRSIKRPIDIRGVQGKIDDISYTTVSTLPHTSRLIEDLSINTEKIWFDLFPQSTPRDNSASLITSVGTAAWRTLEDLKQEPYYAESPCSLDAYLAGTQELSEEHKGNVVRLWKRLQKSHSINRMQEVDQMKIQRALAVAYVGLWGKITLRSLEESINRAAGIAWVLGDLDVRSDDDYLLTLIISGILHEVIKEHSDNTVVNKALTESFGVDVRILSQDYLKLPRFMARRTNYTEDQAEIQLQMLIACAEDYRTLYIRIADRVHAMRVLRKLPLDDLDRKKIAQEALYVYAPLAHKMGLMSQKGELEDMAMSIIDPELVMHARYTQTAAYKAYHDAIDGVQELKENDLVLRENKVAMKVTHRVKGKCELLRKMERKGLRNPKQVKDVLGMRLILDVPQRRQECDAHYTARCHSLCYYVTERLRHMPGFEPVENGFKDYIKGIKKNGYESLHQYVRDSQTKSNVEMQVRTKQMHQKAELGSCAHWYYKDTLYRTHIAHSRMYRMAWRSPEQMQAKSCAEMLGLARKQLRETRVFVYLDDASTVLNLPKHASALDAAFFIHTNVGLTATSVKIGGKTVPFGQSLSNGDVLRVELSDNGVIQANPSWLASMNTSKAQTLLRRYFRTYAQSKAVSTGLAVLLSSMASNEGAIRERFGGSWPTAQRLAEISPSRTGMSITELLLQLGSASGSVEVKRLLTRLIYGSAGLSSPSRSLVTLSGPAAITYASMQSHGWEDADMLNSLLLPMLREVIPSESSADTSTDDNDSNIDDDTNDGGVESSPRKAVDDLQHVDTVWMEMMGPNTLVPAALVQRDMDKLEDIIKQQQRKPVIALPEWVAADEYSAAAGVASPQDSSDGSTVPRERDVSATAATDTSTTNAAAAVSRHQDQWMRGLGRDNARYALHTRHAARSPYVIAQKPFSLEAPSIPPKLRSYARRKLAAEQIAKQQQLQQAMSRRQKERDVADNFAKL